MKTNIKTLMILVGIPCSGKSTWANRLFANPFLSTVVLSRDNIRKLEFGSNYIQSFAGEIIITKKYNKSLDLWLINPKIDRIILDNTHCREKYIDEIISKYSKSSDCYIKIRYFECSLIKSYIRNVIRYIKTRRWIPFKVIKQMKKSFDSINREKYKQYE